MRYLCDVTEQKLREYQSGFPVFRPNSTHVIKVFLFQQRMRYMFV